LISQTTTQLDSPASDPLQEKGYGSLSLKRLAILNVATFGIYQIYWFYRTAKALHERGNLKVIPELCLIGLLVPVLNPVVVFGLFKTISNVAQSNKIDTKFSPLAATTILTIANIMLAMNLWQGATHNEPTHHATLLVASIIFYLVLSTGVLWSWQKILNKISLDF